MSILKELRAIKAFRQNRAEMAVARSRQALADSNAERDTMENRLSAHREHAVSVERDLYRDMCSRIVKLADIEDVQLSIQQLRQQEAAHEEALAAAEKARLKAEETLSADRAQLQTASKQHQKFVELTDAHAKEAGREAERKEELELEEVAGILHEREEWGGDAVLLQ